MVEMLGVLAIIGVLSVGAIAGYSKAMMKYKLNKHAEQMNTVINAIARNAHNFNNIKEVLSLQQLPARESKPLLVLPPASFLERRLRVRCFDFLPYCCVFGCWVGGILSVLKAAYLKPHNANSASPLGLRYAQGKSLRILEIC